MQYKNWVDVAAEVQQRDPQRLMPRPLNPRIVIRPCEKKTEPFSEGFMGYIEKFNPGDYGDDFQAVIELLRGNGYSNSEVFQMLFLDQGFRSYLMAEDSETGEIVGCAQLSRIQVGGYVYMTDDLQIKHLYVKPEYRGLGIANNMVHELLTRIKPNQRAWSFVSKDTPEFNFFFSAGFVGITWSEAGKVFPGVLWAFLWPFHQQRLKVPDTIYFAAEGRGDENAYNPAG